MISLYCTALHCTILYCTALHCTALHCNALHCTILHCTALIPCCTDTVLHLWTALILNYTGIMSGSRGEQVLVGYRNIKAG